MASDLLTLVSAGTVITADGESDWTEIPRTAHVEVYVDITNVGGGSDSFTCWLEGAPHLAADAVRPFELVADKRLETPDVAVATEPTVSTNVRNITDAEDAISRHWALYAALAARTIRLRWIASGSVTIEAKAAIK